MNTQRILSRLKKYPLKDYLAGFLFSSKFDRKGVLVYSDGRPYPKIIHRGGTLMAGNCQFYSGVRIEIGEKAILQIGDGTYLNRNTLIVCEEAIRIGKNCKIAWDVIIMDSDLHSINAHAVVNKPVEIGDNVWIGCRSVILKGVKIGEGAIIAAGSVVTKEIPSYTVWAGTPARQIAKLEQSGLSKLDLFSQSSISNRITLGLV
ncbi:MAG: acyltransferase [Balneolales bacterium]|nr:acyltransferase [Balneolales bacterium]